MSSQIEFPCKRISSLLHRAAVLVVTPYGDFVSTLIDPPPSVFNFPFDSQRRYIVTDCVDASQDLGEYVNGEYRGVPLEVGCFYELRPEEQEAEEYDKEHKRWWIKQGFLREP